MSLDTAPPVIPRRPTRVGSRRGWIGALLLSPSVLFLLAFLVLPALVLMSYSVMTQYSNGNMGFPLQLHGYAGLFTNETFGRVFWVTVKISLWTSLFCTLLAYPVAMVICFGNRRASSLALVLVVLPMVVSVLVRTYGWQVILSGGRSNFINWVLAGIGLPTIDPHLIYTPTAVIIASVHVYLPLMVLPIATSLGRIPSSMVPAARLLGASAIRAFWRITLPLTLPGLVAGVTIVFSLTAASYVTPDLIGGPQGATIGILLQQQMVSTYDWSTGGAIAVAMVVLALSVNVGLAWWADSRLRARERPQEGKA